jgi:hypothetical protein
VAVDGLVEGDQESVNVLVQPERLDGFEDQVGVLADRLLDRAVVGVEFFELLFDQSFDAIAEGLGLS